MKKVIFAGIAAAVFLTCCTPIIYTYDTRPDVNNNAQQQASYEQPQTDQVFYDGLSPYGQWMDYPDYGYVWQPNVGADFRPYATNGQWIYSDAGWTWASDYDWGWAPFHYGRWFYDDSYGWLWMPGHQWAPAWVTWGQSGNYYGWAPLPPRVNVNSGWRPRNDDWDFVPAQHINKVNVNNYVVKNNTYVVNNTTIINNVSNNYTTTNVNNTFIYNRGPNVNQVENITNIKIQQFKIYERGDPGRTFINNSQVNVYRPAIAQSAQQGNNRPAPRNTINFRPNTNPGAQQ